MDNPPGALPHAAQTSGQFLWGRGGRLLHQMFSSWVQHATKNWAQSDLIRGQKDLRSRKRGSLGGGGGVTSPNFQ